MSNQNRFSCAGAVATLIFGTLSSAAVFAADNAQTSTESKINPAAIQKALAARHALIVASHRNATVQRKAGAKDIFANPDAAYPPSCLNDGLLPFGTTGLPYAADPNAQQFQATLLAYDSNTAAFDIPEADTFTIWRVPCSGGVSATLLEIDRPSSVNGNEGEYPNFPNIYLTQGSAIAAPRLPQDPNTVFSDTELVSPFIYSSIYVFENYNASASLSPAQINYNTAFTLNIDTLSVDANDNEIIVAANIPAYNPASFNNFPSASLPMEISGYMSTNWYDPNHSGEGILTQIYDADSSSRIFSAAWYTFDPLGIPFWLFAQGTIDIGATEAINVPTYYFVGGGFAGDFGATANGTQWGTMSFSFPDCNTMTFSFNGQTDAQTNGPKGSGTRTWTRAANINSLVCQ